MEQQLPVEATAATAAGGVVLRVKRRRDSQAPQQIVLEASSRAAALVTDFERSLAVGSVVSKPQPEAAAARAPPRKRCRFVLLNSAEVQQRQEQQQQADVAANSAQPAAEAAATASAASQFVQQPAAAAAAAAGVLPPGCTRVLDLWHTTGLAQTSTTSSISAAATGQHFKHASASAVAAGTAQSQEQQRHQQLSVYEEMVQQYLQEHPEPSAAAAKPHRPHIPPSRGLPRHHPAAAAEPQQQQQGQQWQARVLPEYMTRDMLQQYGLVSHITDHLQPHVKALAAPTSDSATAAMGVAAAAAAVDTDQEYVYDMYVPVTDEEMESAEPLEGQQPGAMPVVQVWEEDLQDFDDLWTAGAGAGAAGDEDSEDSNAEGYYANSYPDEEDSYQNAGDQNDSYNSGGRCGNSDGSYGSSEEEECYGWGAGSNSGAGLIRPAAAARVTVLDPAGLQGVSNAHGHGLLTCYHQHSKQYGQHPCVADKLGSDEGGCASEDEDEQQQQGLVGGAAWRAVLAEQFAPRQQREM